LIPALVALVFKHLVARYLLFIFVQCYTCHAISPRLQRQDRSRQAPVREAAIASKVSPAS
jgi:hypothetical protein